MGASTYCNPRGLSRPVPGLVYLYLYLYLHLLLKFRTFFWHGSMWFTSSTQFSKCANLRYDAIFVAECQPFGRAFCLHLRGMLNRIVLTPHSRRLASSLSAFWAPQIKQFEFNKEVSLIRIVAWKWKIENLDKKCAGKEGWGLTLIVHACWWPAVSVERRLIALPFFCCSLDYDHEDCDHLIDQDLEGALKALEGGEQVQSCK
jgi:hypothetical protein